jgi:hypothetical protein
MKAHDRLADEPGATEVIAMEKGEQLSPLAAFAVFMFIGFAITFLLVPVDMAVKIFWSDILHDNPHHSVWDAILQGLKMVPTIGIAVCIGYYTGALVTAASLAAVTAKIWGRVPFKALFVMVPACAIAIGLQVAWLITIRLLPDGPEYDDDPAVVAMVIAGTLRFLPSLIGSWWVLRRMTIRKIEPAA